MRLRIVNRPGMLARVLNAIATEEGDPGAIDVVSASHGFKVRDITVAARNDEHAKAVIETIRRLNGIEVVNVSDRVFLMHLGGKIQSHNKIALTTRDALSMEETVRNCAMTGADKPARITIRRDHHADTRERQVYARVDDAPTHVLMFGETVTIEIAAGSRCLRTNNTLFWKGRTFSLETGEHAEFTLINRGIWEGMRGLLPYFTGAVPLRLQIKFRLGRKSPGG